MPLYDYGCKTCGYEWEVQHKLSDPGPGFCPECKEHSIGKLLSAVRGTVELTGHELKSKLKSDAQKLTMEASRSENLLANLVGEDKYQANTVLREDISKGKFD